MAKKKMRFGVMRLGRDFHCRKCEHRFGKTTNRIFDNTNGIVLCVPCAELVGFTPTGSQAEQLANGTHEAGTPVDDATLMPDKPAMDRQIDTLMQSVMDLAVQLEQTQKRVKALEDAQRVAQPLRTASEFEREYPTTAFDIFKR